MKKNLLLVYLLVCMAGFALPSVQKIDSLRSEISKANPAQYSRLFALMADACKGLSAQQTTVEIQKTLKMASQLGDIKVQIYAHEFSGNLYAAMGNRSEGLAQLQLAYELSKENELLYERGITSLALGQFYLAAHFLTEAVEKTYEANQVFRSLSDTLQLFKTHSLISLINYRSQHYKETIEESQKAIESFRKLKEPVHADSIELMSVYNTMALSAYLIDDLDLGLQTFEQAEKIALSLKAEFWVGLINGNRAKIYRKQGFTARAIENFKIDFQTSKKFKEWSSACNSAITLADIYLDEKNSKEAKSFLDTVVSILPRIKENRVRLREAKIRARYYDVTGELKKVIEAQRDVIRLMDSVRIENERLDLGRYSARYDLEKKQNEIAFLKQSNELQTNKIENQRLIIWSAGVILALVVLLVLVIVRDSRQLKTQYRVISLQGKEIENKNEELETQSQRLQEQNELISSINLKLEEKVQARTAELEFANKELDKFLYHASHDIRRPIATLLGLEKIFHLSDREQWQVLFEKVADTAHSMDSMLYKLHMVYELNRPNTEKSEVNLHETIDHVSNLFEADFKQSNINYVHVRDKPVIFLSVPVLLEVILRNLMENAIHFRKPHEDEKPNVRVSSSIANNIVSIKIEDNGIGIDSQYIDRVFDLYFRGTQQSKGNGLGLYLVNKATAMLGGTIKIESEPGVGSTFTVFLPTNS